MIEVYVRHVDSDAGQLLGKFKPEQVKKLPDLFGTFATMFDGLDCQPVGFGFVVDDGAYFEIVIGEAN